MPDRTATIEAVCELIATGRTSDAAILLTRDYPFTAATLEKRRYGPLTCTRIFVRDGFIDRYAATRLVFPGALRLISRLLPEAFPFHSNWKMSSTHPAYWELFPTIDHIIPVAKGGVDHESNWVTTSQLRNSAKCAWTLDELGWQLHPPGDMRMWDGLLPWFLEMVQADTSHLGDNYIRMWHHAAIIVKGKQSLI